MADNTTKNDTDAGNSQNMDDTRTRKTLKLKPVSKDKKPVIDPLTMRNTDTGPLEAMDDTRTRQTVKLKPAQGSLKPVVDPLTQRNTETGPLEAMVDTRTRQTVKLKPLKTAKVTPAGAPSTATETPEGEEKAEGAPKMYKETNTRKTLKLKPVNPAEKKPGLKLGGSDAKSFKDTNTRKTLKLKPIGGTKKPGLAPNAPSSAATPPTTPAPAPTKAEEKPAEKEEFDDTRTRKTITKAPAKKTVQLTPPGAKAPAAAPITEEGPSDDTIKIKRPEKKPDAVPMPSLGAPAAAKAVSNKDTVKLRPPSAAGGKPAAPGAPSEAKASKETIKLSPKPAAAKEESAAGEKPAEEKPAPDQAPTVNLKLKSKKPAKSKLTIGKPPPPKTPPKEEEAAPEASTAPGGGGGGGLKLKTMAPKTEAPRAQADQQKIKEIKKGGPKAKSQASPIYTLVAIIAVVLVAFSALVTAVQYFNLWDQETIGGNPIEIPVLKDMVK